MGSSQKDSFIYDNIVMGKSYTYHLGIACLHIYNNCVQNKSATPSRDKPAPTWFIWLLDPLQSPIKEDFNLQGAFYHTSVKIGHFPGILF